MFLSVSFNLADLYPRYASQHRQMRKQPLCGRMLITASVSLSGLPILNSTSGLVPHTFPNSCPPSLFGPDIFSSFYHSGSGSFLQLWVTCTDLQFGADLCKYLEKSIQCHWTCTPAQACPLLGLGLWSGDVVLCVLHKAHGLCRKSYQRLPNLRIKVIL